MAFVLVGLTSLGRFVVLLVVICCFLPFNVLVANPKKLLLYTVGNPARGLRNREKKEMVWESLDVSSVREILLFL